MRPPENDDFLIVLAQSYSQRDFPEGILDCLFMADDIEAKRQIMRIYRFQQIREEIERNAAS